MDFYTSMVNVAWFRDRYLEGHLQLRPPYQRKPVWAARQKCHLVESILMGVPIPEIYVQQKVSPDGTTTYAIVDGQQRIRAMLQFLGAELEPKEQEYNKFALDKLDVQSQWSNLTFEELSDDEKKQFYGYRFAVRYLNTDKEEDVQAMFRRLNQFSVPLSAQELRNATYSGPFMTMAQRLADSEYWSENRIVRAASIRRMGDIEFVSELLIGVLHGPQGGSARVINEYYQQYEDYQDEFPGQAQAAALFDDTLVRFTLLLPDIRETRWSNKTDFYTLFVCTAYLLRTHELPTKNIEPLRAALDDFSDQVARRLEDERATVSPEAVSYVRAHEKGANDKKRRADRHVALLSLIQPHFRKKSAS